LERAIARALRRSPCLVSFSGGHDSSLILAAATKVARREQLPAAVTWRPDGAPAADESAWQEAVVAALQVSDWIRLAADDDLDFVGPVVTGVPTGYESRPARASGRRDLELTCQSLALLGRDVGTDVVHPLLDPEFLTAVCGSGALAAESAGGRARIARSGIRPGLP
jgi:hypothetical protein